MTFRTWQGELAVVAVVLGGVLIATRASLVELVGSGAVLASFAHGQVSDRLAEREASRERPDVHCHAWARRYFLTKEALWLVYFIAKGAWSAFVGCVVFLAYPAWRTWWRRRAPLSNGETSGEKQ